MEKENYVPFISEVEEFNATIPDIYVKYSQTGSFATTGSNIFRGDQTVTGSLFTTGSNTLVGNTILSGTLQIQGEYPPSVGSASVNLHTPA